MQPASPADVVAEVAASNASWLHSFMDALPVQGEVLASPRLAPPGRLGWYEGRLDEAIALLGSAVSTFEEGGLHLDVWHVGSVACGGPGSRW